ncbi:hypothetical protein [Arthrobacter sp. efr-133-TYG-118]|uniref:hypothetical protein n=1 Tax=Arthrobacter sp. efr-133-TYG-118 TaxID=3040279 RepID=UPI00254FBECC|nr:hypothetical protein [Arthrobacter sp. efr-133-TYG-118]
MRGSYFGLPGAFVGVVVVPTRRIPAMAVHDLPGLLIWVLLLVLTASLAIAGLRRLSDVKPANH